MVDGKQFRPYSYHAVSAFFCFLPRLRIGLDPVGVGHGFNSGEYWHSVPMTHDPNPVPASLVSFFAAIQNPP